MKKIFLYSCLAFSTVLPYSCTDLEEQVEDNFTETFEPTNPGVGQSTNVNGSTPADGLNSAFQALLGSSANHGNYFSIQEVSTDEAVITQKGGDWFDGGIWLRMHQHTWGSTHDALNNAWNNTYEGIVNANLLLADTDVSVEGKAQVRTARAYYYWRLLDLFGRVKIVTESNPNPAQSSRTELFNFVESELLAALPNLPEGKQAYGRVSKSAANGLLARLYLNAEVYTGNPMWQQAVDAADEVINSAAYELDDNYAAVFAPDNVENPEHIWVVPFDEATGQGMNLGQMTFPYSSQLTYQFQEQPWNGYSTLEEFYNSYDDADSRKESNFVVGPQFDVSGNPILDVAFDPADPDGAAVNFTPAINELAPNGSRQAGARFGKFAHKQKQASNMDNDYPLIRYAGVLLDKAEALMRMNGEGDGTALMLVNQIRERAGIDAYTSLSMDEMLAERGRELFLESLRRNDLIRFGKWGDAWWEKDAYSDSNRNVFPIPQAQIDASSGTLTQNDGY